MRAAFVILLFFLLAGACSPVSKRSLFKSFQETERRFQDHTGFMLYDPEKKKSIFQYNAATYFTPASNTKILTLYTCLNLLGDSIPGLRYTASGDSLFFWGTGDPSFLYKNVYNNGRVFQFLDTTHKQLFFCPTNFYTTMYGPGWSWEDYQYAFSAERSAMPVYGNIFDVKMLATQLQVQPPFFKKYIQVQPDTNQQTNVIRLMNTNHTLFIQGKSNSTTVWTRPFHVDSLLVPSLLADTLKRQVSIASLPVSAAVSTFYSVPADSLYKVMMQESDNFIAEQLLLVCSGVLSDSLKPEIPIRYMKEKFMQDVYDEPVWRDGSGLSRYNLFTPRSVVKIWEKIYTLAPRERLFKILAIGGVAGTIKNYYRSEPPYIFGKTGTLSGVHCLSGYLVTRKGKTLIFSFMNTNYTQPTKEVRNRMEQVLALIRDHY